MSDEQRPNIHIEGDAIALLRTIVPRIDAESAAKIARLCGHLPLALRLAASLLKEYDDTPLERYIAQLEDETQRLPALDDEAEQLAGIPGLQASLQLSLNMLDEATCQHWAMLSAFPADFDFPAVQAIWATDDETAEDHLRELRRHSLIDWNAATKRYHLHDLARLAARARLSEAQRHTAGLRHAVHYKDVLANANQLYLKGGDHVLEGLAIYDREQTNIHAGQQWAAQQSDKDTEAAQAANLYAGQGSLLNLRLHPRQNIAWLNDGLAAAQQLGDKENQGVHLGNLGLMHADLGEIPRAIEFYEQDLEIARQIGDRRGEGSALGNLGLAYTDLGEIPRAIEYHQQVLEIMRQIGDKHGEGSALGNLGLAYAALGEIPHAIEHYEQWLGISRQIGDRRGEGSALGNLGTAYHRLGEIPRAIEYYQQQLEIARQIDDRRGEGVVLGNLGSAYYSLEEYGRAIEFYEQQLETAREVGDRYGEANARWGQAICAEQDGDLAQAIAYAEMALALFEQVQSPSAQTMRDMLAKWGSSPQIGQPGKTSP